MPKEIFELDKDERWAARLDEARARREVALREKAAGKPQKPRPKPWEIEGAAVEKPTVIEPIMQERGDDKFDFADRLETIRDPKSEDADEAVAAAPTPTSVPEPTPTPVPTPAPSPARPPVAELRREPGPVEVPPEPAATQQRAPAPEARARPQPSLVLPGAPDVAELAARYAATLETAAPDLDEEVPEPTKKTADLVALPTAARPADVTEPELDPAPHADPRRGIRPLGMALGLIAFAVLPLTTMAPPLETGPGMPQVDVLRIQPALGVTWSLSERPRLTRSGEWVPRAKPATLAAVPALLPSTGVSSSVARPPVPSEGAPALVDWTGLERVARFEAPALDAPTTTAGRVPVIADATAAPVLAKGQVLIIDAANGVSAPPRPVGLIDNAGEAATPPPAAIRSDTAPVVVIEATPLRVTILAPARSDRTLTEAIASGVQTDGYELVRVKDVEFSISERNLRYFHEADRASAARMAERYDAELRDFTWFEPSPLEGTVELWLAGRAPLDASAAQVQRPQTSGADEQSELLNRVFDRLGLGTDLPEAVPNAAGSAASRQGGTGN